MKLVVVIGAGVWPEPALNWTNVGTPPACTIFAPVIAPPALVTLEAAGLVAVLAPDWSAVRKLCASGLPGYRSSIR